LDGHADGHGHQDGHHATGTPARQDPAQAGDPGATLGNVLVSVTVIGYYLHAGVDAPDPTAQ